MIRLVNSSLFESSTMSSFRVSVTYNLVGPIWPLARKDLEKFSKMSNFFIGLIDRECRDSSTCISTRLVYDA